MQILCPSRLRVSILVLQSDNIINDLNHFLLLSVDNIFLCFTNTHTHTHRHHTLTNACTDIHPQTPTSASVSLVFLGRFS